MYQKDLNIFLLKDLILINFKKNFFDPIFLCKDLILSLNLIGIFGILTKPSVKALKYKPVPPTRMGFFFLFLISKIFLLTNFNQSPVENFFLHFEIHINDV